MRCMYICDGYSLSISLFAVRVVSAYVPFGFSVSVLHNPHNHHRYRYRLQLNIS